ncbi:MAG TPA: DUF2283 domain-containing protein [Nitrososphaerales archaeon]|nr:DUF2283 domain-containing protein [Nitrososphaerales archaeon]
MASLEFDRKTDALYLRLRKGKVSSSEPLADNMVVDLDSRKRVVGLELLLPPTMNKEIRAQLLKPSKH